eukprot:1768893-Amphidinium_carterae.2
MQLWTLGSRSVSLEPLSTEFLSQALAGIMFIGGIDQCRGSVVMLGGSVSKCLGAGACQAVDIAHSTLAQGSSDRKTHNHPPS